MLLLPAALATGPVCGQELPVTTEVVATVDTPVFLTHAPGDIERLFVVGQHGVVSIIREGALLDRPFLDLSTVVLDSGTEQGLLGLAFHPQYETNGFFYLAYTVPPDGEAAVVRYEVTADADLADPASAQLVIERPSQTPTHNAGWIGFGADGYLYIASGDGGGPVDPGDDAQNLDSLLGKILRLDVNCDEFPEDPQRNYGIPPDNPFVGVPGADEVWAYGLRNPWRCSFDRVTGDFYVGDVGQSAWEEVSFLPAGASGANFGWDCKEAVECTGEPTCACDDPSLIDPIHFYANPDAGRAVIGGYVYRGCAIPELEGSYLFADHWSNRFWRLQHDSGRVTLFEDITDDLDPPGADFLRRASSFGEDLLGELYICSRTTGRIYRIVPTGQPSPDCNANGIRDACDIAAGTSVDSNGDGVPDECTCPWDLDGSGAVGTSDFLALLAQWGTDPAGPPDFDGDGIVGVADFLDLLGHWGACP